jgi:ABC-type branched-subunit amino acid transport system ATPase component
VLSGALLVFFILFFRNGLVAVPRLIGDLIAKARGRVGAPVVADIGVPTGDLEPALATAGGNAGNLGQSHSLGTTSGFAPSAHVDVTELADIPDHAVAMDVDGGDGATGDRLRDETPLVVVEGLTKRFDSLVAVEGVSFSLRPGYITAMIGPNGAGKSTVINMLSGTLIPSAGAVGIMGKPAVGLAPHEIARLGLARTFQTPRLFEGMTLLETVMLARDRYGSRSWLWGSALKTPRALRDERESREQALDWLAYVGIAEDANELAVSLTTGKQRLAELARALATEPTVLLLDEPAAGLDGRETQTLSGVIQNLANAGIAVLLVEHDMGMVMAIADHVVVLEEGKKIAEGTAAEISSDQAVVDAYLGVVHA